MPDYSDTIADQSTWKPLPVPTEACSAQCFGKAVRITFKADRSATVGFVMKPGEAIPLKAGQAGYIRPDTALNGGIVIESIG